MQDATNKFFECPYCKTILSHIYRQYGHTDKLICFECHADQRDNEFVEGLKTPQAQLLTLLVQGVSLQDALVRLNLDIIDLDQILANVHPDLVYEVFAFINNRRRYDITPSEAFKSQDVSHPVIDGADIIQDVYVMKFLFNNQSTREQRKANWRRLHGIRREAARNKKEVLLHGQDIQLESSYSASELLRWIIEECE